MPFNAIRSHWSGFLLLTVLLLVLVSSFVGSNYLREILDISWVKQHVRLRGVSDVYVFGHLFSTRVLKWVFDINSLVFLVLFVLSLLALKLAFLRQIIAGLAVISISVSVAYFVALSPHYGFAFSANAPSPLRFSERLIEDHYTYGYGMDIADIDGDGDLDITTGDAAFHEGLHEQYWMRNPDHKASLYWYENVGGSFEKRYVEKGFLGFEMPEGRSNRLSYLLERHDIGDIDGDGKLDIAIVVNSHGGVALYLQGTDPDGSVTWRRIIATRELEGAYDVALADVNNDGRLDLVTSSWRLGNGVAWFENPGHFDGEWQKHVIDHDPVNLELVRNVIVEDFDGDGDVEVAASAELPGQVLYYDRGSNGWEREAVAQIEYVSHIIQADVDGDGEFELIAPSRAGSIDLLKREADGWSATRIIDTPTPWFSVAAGDLDGDGDVDFAAVSLDKRKRRPSNQHLAWFENQGDEWKMHIIRYEFVRGNDIRIADMDGDGRLDIVAISEVGTHELKWWRNDGPPHCPIC